MARPKKRAETTNIRVDRTIAERLSKRAEQEGKLAIDYTNEQLLMSLECNEMLKDALPSYSYTASPEEIVVRCHKESKGYYHVTIRNNQLVCEQDGRGDCIHVVYASGTVEVRRRLLTKPKLG